MTNLRFGAYLLVALGFINMRYQTGHHDIVMHSFSIIFPGVLLLLATFIKPAQKFLGHKNTKLVIGTMILLLIGYSFIN
ncbi:MAG: hypothetical protein NTU82_00750 [Actinobacteria bacterium]|nr:hypothetical protein [Actinomycetota bacterium]